MITAKAKYALKALIYMAQRHGQGPVIVDHMVRDEHMPRKFLEAIMLTLRNNGILTSRKGKGGGYEFVQSPDRISMASILRIIDGPIAPLPCVSLNFYAACEDCEDEVACKLRKALVAVRDANLKVLERTSLAQIANLKGGEDLLAY